MEAFLGHLDQDYAQYAPALWQNGVRRADQLANADKEDLIAAGVTSAIHAKDIKTRAGTQGHDYAGQCTLSLDASSQSM